MLKQNKLFKKYFIPVFFILISLFFIYANVIASKPTLDAFAIISLDKKNYLEEKIVTCLSKIEQIEFDRINVQGEIDWTNSKIDRLVNFNHKVPKVVGKSLKYFEQKKHGYDQELNRINESKIKYLEKLNALNAEIKKAYTDKANSWWKVNPKIKNLLKSKKIKIEITNDIVFQNIKSLKEEIEKKLADNKILNDWMSLLVKKDSLWLVTRLPILFGKDSSKVSSGYKKLFDAIAKFIKQYDVRIRVEGFANIKKKTAKKRKKKRKKITPADNWILSARRASNIAEALVKNGVSPSLFTIISRGNYTKSIYNFSKNNKEIERRAEITIYFIPSKQLSPKTNNSNNKLVSTQKL